MLFSAHLYLLRTPIFQALGWALSSFHANPGCVLVVLSHVCPQSGCLCGDEAMAIYREEPVYPSASICDGLFPQSSCCSNIYFVQRPRESESEREREREQASQQE